MDFHKTMKNIYMSSNNNQIDTFQAYILRQFIRNCDVPKKNERSPYMAAVKAESVKMDFLHEWK